MINGADLSSKFTLDTQGLNQLKLEAKQSSPEALKQAAQQFEAVFMNMLMKSMREATPQEGMFDSEQTRMYTSMLDQQLTQRMASRGIGLADVMVRQLSIAMSIPPAVEGGTPEGGVAVPGLPAQGFPLNAPSLVTPQVQTRPVLSDSPRVSNIPHEESDLLRAKVSRSGIESYGPQTDSDPLRVKARVEPNAPAHVDAFVQRMLPHAQEASASTGIPPQFMMGQAALETGWGKAEIRGAGGENSYNLFGIKAGSGWRGRTVDIVTTEYVNGKPQKQVDTFRAYDSYADSFRDYANLLRANPRYQNVLAQGQDARGFAQGLQQAGYATDPSYAQKLASVIKLVERV
ncbi:MAG: flagellar assembly peptidoglycan hydrolase FlgJ [Sulfuriferula multivorans]|uniref:Peptidoglycan hydrolase FlgJ n=1 Tax=Sulfuriferula multivorans TaxID=1559896 RepID=A0A7C9P6Q3_9PROT|nr:flagellar assembly peptidoglycan hydrolase FlgJ [Sulfuriferula multivorans]